MLTSEQLKQIGAAKTLELRVLGDRQNVTGTPPPEFVADAAQLAIQAP